MDKGFVIGDRGLSLAGDSHPDWDVGFIDYKSIRIIGASAVGQDHIKRQKPRDDSFLIRSAGPWIAVAVSDGLGAHPLSRFGSSQAVEALTSHMLRPLIAEMAILPPDENLVPIRLKPQLERITQKNIKTTNKDIEWLSRVFNKKNSLGIKLPFYKFGTTTQEETSNEHEITPLDDDQTAGTIGFWQKAMEKPFEPNIEVEQEISKVQNSGFLESEELEKVMKQAFSKTHLWLAGLADNYGIGLRDIGCTCIGLLFNINTQQFCVGQVGDGACLGLKDKTILELIIPFETGDLSKVVPITSSQWENNFSIKVWTPTSEDQNWFESFYVMTDGVSNDLLFTSDVEALNNWGRVMLNNLQKPQTSAQAATELLDWLATYKVPGSWDDRTLVIMAKRD